MKGGGAQPDPNKVKAVQRIPVPTCVKDIHSFLGLQMVHTQLCCDREVTM